jgi:hypothetical protein
MVILLHLAVNFYQIQQQQYVVQILTGRCTGCVGTRLPTACNNILVPNMVMFSQSPITITKYMQQNVLAILDHLQTILHVP